MSATGILNKDSLEFTTNGTTTFVKVVPATGSLKFEGANSTDKLRLTNLSTGTDGSDAATRDYVDTVAQGLHVKDAVRVATTAAATLSTDFQAGDTIDNVTLAEGDRILIKDQADAKENGIYTVNASTAGAPTRATDFDGDADVTGGAFTFVQEGGVNQDKGFVMTTNGTIAIGSTALAFSQFSKRSEVLAGTGLQKDSATNTLSVKLATSTTIEVSADNLEVKQSSITRDHMASKTIRAEQIDDNTITKDQIAAATITTSELADNAVDGDKLADNIVVAGTLALTANVFSVDTTGKCSAVQFVAASDRSLKRGIEPLEPGSALDAVRQMQACSYTFKDDPGDPRCGVIAQELQQVAPELVKTTAAGTLAVDYNDMSAYLIAAVQALHQRVEEQDALLARLVEQQDALLAAA